MKKQDILLLSVSLILIAYLLINLYWLPLKLDSSITLESLKLQQNTQVIIYGVPENIKKYSESVNFEINNITIKANTKKAIYYQNISVIGLVRQYNNKTYLEAVKIEYVD